MYQKFGMKLIECDEDATDTSDASSSEEEEYREWLKETSIEEKEKSQEYEVFERQSFYANGHYFPFNEEYFEQNDDLKDSEFMWESSDNDEVSTEEEEEVLSEVEEDDFTDHEEEGSTDDEEEDGDTYDLSVNVRRIPLSCRVMVVEKIIFSFWNVNGQVDRKNKVKMKKQTKTKM